MGKVKYILFLLLLPVLARGQSRMDRMPVKIKVHIEQDSANKKIIPYSLGQSLTLSDFKGRADRYSSGVAETFSGIVMKYVGKNEGGVIYIDVKLQVYFDKTKSWTKPEGHNEEVLAHEQIHFDITAIYACAFAQAIKEYPFTAANVRAEMDALNKKFDENMKRAQANYDRETGHGTIRRKQAEWAANIRTQLNKLTCYP
jgi:hypothetical protein